MRLTRKGVVRTMEAVALIVIAASAYAQNPVTTRSVSFQIVAVVPPVLNLTLDFASGNATTLTGYYSNGGVPVVGVSYARGTEFQLKSYQSIELGNARLFSNVNNAYSIRVTSLNDGQLRNEAASSRSVPYLLKVGNSVAASLGGVFSFSAFGKTNRGGIALPVSIILGGVPSASNSGAYTDTIVFGISAN